MATLVSRVTDLATRTRVKLNEHTTALASLTKGRQFTIPDLNALLQAGTNVTIACEGDSLTAGYLVGGPRNTTIGGYTFAIASKTYPEALSDALNAAWPGKVTVMNRGYPGHTTNDGMTFWAGAAAVNAVIIAYGYNDALLGVSLATFRTNLRAMVLRRVAGGTCAVAILAMPWREDSTVVNQVYDTYRAVMREVAAEFGILFVDGDELMRTHSGIVEHDGDLIHFTADGYRRVGWNVAAPLLPVGVGMIRHVGPGMQLWANEAFGGGVDGTGPNIYINPVSVSQFLFRVPPGKTLVVPLYVEADCVPVVTLSNATTTYRSLYVYVNGTDTGGFRHEIGFAADGANFRQSFQLERLSRGYRVLAFKNAGTDDAYIDTIDFAAEKGSTDKYGMVDVGLAGVEKPSFAGVGTAIWWSRVSGMYFPQIQRLEARMILDDNDQNGIGLAKNRETFYAHGSSTQYMFLRSGSSFVARSLTNNAASPADVVYAAAFPVGGEVETLIELYFFDERTDIYLNGVQFFPSISGPAYRWGYPSIVALGASYPRCLSFQASNH